MPLGAVNKFRDREVEAARDEATIEFAQDFLLILILEQVKLTMRCDLIQLMIWEQTTNKTEQLHKDEERAKR